MKSRSPRRTCLALASLFTALTALVSLADPIAAEEPQPSDTRGELTAYRFDDDLVKGDTANPNGEVLHVRKRRARESLVRARTHWVPELLKTAEDL